MFRLALHRGMPEFQTVFLINQLRLTSMKMKIQNMEGLMRDLMELCFTTEYANEKGAIQWSKFTGVLSQLIRTKGQDEGAAAAAQNQMPVG